MRASESHLPPKEACHRGRICDRTDHSFSGDHGCGPRWWHPEEVQGKERRMGKEWPIALPAEFRFSGFFNGAAFPDGTRY